MSEVMQIGGVDLRCLAQKVGTPFLIYDETKVEQKLQAFRHHFVHPEFETQVVYAGKAFLCGKIVRMVHEAGCGLDVVSGGELGRCASCRNAGRAHRDARKQQNPTRTDRGA